MDAGKLENESIASLGPRLARKEISPVDLVKAALGRIEEHDGKIKAFITVCAEQALEAARSAEAEISAGRYRGPLHGIPVSLKDLVSTHGIRTTAGSKILADWIPQADAAIAKKLKDAGAIILGKTSLHEFAYGPTGVNPHYGTAQNPWSPGRIPGGSSSGSGASVAHALCPGSIGTDSGGSIRIPASLMGIVGLKPTYGLVSLRGIVPLAWSLDHGGPMTRTVADSALMLQAIAGHHAQDPASRLRAIPDYSLALQGDVKGMRIGLVKEYLDSPMEEGIKQATMAFAGRLEGLGVKVEEVSLPQLRYASVLSFLIMASESMAYHRRFMKTRAADYGEDIRTRLVWGSLCWPPSTSRPKGCAAFSIATSRMPSDGSIFCSPRPFPSLHLASRTGKSCSQENRPMSVRS
jgi:aspartyl-tRNA(Asn)/glutamyl-tRNA(Gln) amidotransferase subunit A